jgi:hypothetical protein
MTQQVPGRAGSSRTKKVALTSIIGAAVTLTAALAALWAKDPDLAVKIGATGGAITTFLNAVAPMFAHDDAIATAVQVGEGQKMEAVSEAVARAVVLDDAQETRLVDAVANVPAAVVVFNEGETT